MLASIRRNSTVASSFRIVAEAPALNGHPGLSGICTRKLSFASVSESAVARTTIVLLVSPGAKVRVLRGSTPPTKSDSKALPASTIQGRTCACERSPVRVTVNRNSAPSTELEDVPSRNDGVSAVILKT